MNLTEVRRYPEHRESDKWRKRCVLLIDVKSHSSPWFPNLPAEPQKRLCDYRQVLVMELDVAIERSSLICLRRPSLIWANDSPPRCSTRALPTIRLENPRSCSRRAKSTSSYQKKKIRRRILHALPPIPSDQETGTEGCWIESS